jgi:hypothetical protein
MAMSMRMLRDEGEPFAILLEGEDPTTGGQVRYVLPPLVLDPDGRAIAGEEELQLILLGEFSTEIPILRNRRPGDLAVIDQRLAALREEYQALSWPPGT